MAEGRVTLDASPPGELQLCTLCLWMLRARKRTCSRLMLPHAVRSIKDYYIRATASVKLRVARDQRRPGLANSERP